MSRSQLARTPANFPRMKHRAAGRLARRARQTAQSSTPKPLDLIGEFFNRVVNGLAAVGEAVAQALAGPPVRSDFVLLPGLPDPFTDPKGRALVQAIHDRKALADKAGQS